MPVQSIYIRCVSLYNDQKIKSTICSKIYIYIYMYYNWFTAFNNVLENLINYYNLILNQWISTTV